MIKCNACTYSCDYSGKPCPVCGAEMKISEADIKQTQAELESALAEKNLAKIHACRHLLADGGDTESMREYAKLLERGDYQLRDIDTAMAYYCEAAKKYDPYSAYRFSRLVGRSNERAARFWLRFAALLGSIDAYPDAVELFSSEGREDIASYYCSLAAACDDTISIVNMAKRWHEGIGVKENSGCAKWYLDKLVIPPISAIKLAYKLRSVPAEEPEKLTFPDYGRYLIQLAREADALGFDSAYFYLTARLAKAGDINAEATLGALLLEGKGCARDVSRAKAVLEIAINHRNPAAAITLGEEYLSGRILEKNAELSFRYFDQASKLGYPGAYERMGDIYKDGELAEVNLARAIELYDLAAAGGCSSAKEKSNELKAKREEFYLDAYKTIKLTRSVTEDEAFAAFRAAAIATAMGELRAAPLLAGCYLSGFGTKKDRSSAYYWYKYAVDNGDREANLFLGICYSRGIGTRFSYNEAVKYLKIADEIGLKGAAEELNLLYVRRYKKMVRALYSRSVELIYMRKYAEAARLLSSFEALAYPKALYTLGCLYEFGRGVGKTDRVRAEKYYERAFIGNSTFGKFKDPSSIYKLRILKMIK